MSGVLLLAFLKAPPAKEGVIRYISGRNQGFIENLIVGPHLRIGPTTPDRYLYIFARPDCHVCADELPILLRTYNRYPRTTQIVFIWVVRSDVAKLKAALACELSTPQANPEIANLILNQQIATIKDINALARHHGIAPEILMLPGTGCTQTISWDNAAAAKLGVTSTPAFIGCSPGGRCIELDFRQALSYF